MSRMQRMAGIGGWEVDLLTQTLTWTSETYRIHEVTPVWYVPTLSSASDFYVPEHVPTIRKAVARALESGTPFDLELEMINAAGRRLWVRVTGRVQLRGGRPRRLFGLIQDITERRRLEQELLEISRHDRQQAVVGLHDDLGQALTGLSLMLRCLSKRASAIAPALTPDVESIIGLTNEAIGTCRTLAKGLMPVSQDHGGFLSALRELARTYGESRGLAITVSQHGTPDLGMDQLDQLFRIAQDAVVILASREHTTRVKVSLGARQELLVLTVSGDGTDDIVETKLASDVYMLDRRAKLLGAALEISGRRRGGTRIRCALHSIACQGVHRC
jgi:signal transduction histidine kinase